MLLSTVDRRRCRGFSRPSRRPDRATPLPLHLAFSAWAMRDLPVEQQIDLVQRAGYVGICLVSDPSFGSLDPATTSAAERPPLGALLIANDLSLTAVAGHANPLEPDAAKRQANLDRIRAGLDLAADLAGPA